MIPSNSSEEPAADFISPLAPSADVKHAFDAPKSAYQQELKALDSKLSVLILSSNLFCIKAADLPSAAKKRFTDVIEMLLAKRKAHHDGIGVQDFISSLKDAEIIGFGQDQMPEVLASPEIPEAFSFPNVEADASHPDSAGSQVEKSSGPEAGLNKAQAASLRLVDGALEEKVVECSI